MASLVQESPTASGKNVGGGGRNRNRQRKKNKPESTAGADPVSKVEGDGNSRKKTKPKKKGGAPVGVASGPPEKATSSRNDKSGKKTPNKKTTTREDEKASVKMASPNVVRDKDTSSNKRSNRSNRSQRTKGQSDQRTTVSSTPLTKDQRAKETPATCKFDPGCRKKNCKFKHPKQDLAAASVPQKGVAKKKPKKACRNDPSCKQKGCKYGHPKRDASSAAPPTAIKREWGYRKKWIIRNLPPDITEEEILILLERATLPAVAKEPTAEMPKETATPATVESVEDQEETTARTDDLCEDIGKLTIEKKNGALEGEISDEAGKDQIAGGLKELEHGGNDEGGAKEHPDGKKSPKEKEIPPEYKLFGFDYTPSYRRNIPGLWNNYTFFVPGTPNRVNSDWSKPSRLWMVFTDEEVEQRVYQKFGRENGKKVRSQKGTTTTAKMAVAIIQDLPDSDFPGPGEEVVKTDPREGSIFEDPEFLKLVEEIQKLGVAEPLPSAEVQMKEREKAEANAPPIVSPLVAKLMKAREEDEKRKALGKEKEKKKKGRDKKKVVGRLIVKKSTGKRNESAKSTNAGKVKAGNVKLETKVAGTAGGKVIHHTNTKHGKEGKQFSQGQTKRKQKPQAQGSKKSATQEGGKPPATVGGKKDSVGGGKSVKGIPGGPKKGGVKNGKRGGASSVAQKKKIHMV